MEDKLFLLLLTIPILPCVICIIIGGAISVFIMDFLNNIYEYKDPNSDYSENDTEGEE